MGQRGKFLVLGIAIVLTISFICGLYLCNNNDSIREKFNLISGKIIQSSKTNPSFIVAQLTDLHICKDLNTSSIPPKSPLNCPNNGAQVGGTPLVNSVSKINSHLPKVNVTIITGDLTQEGAKFGYMETPPQDPKLQYQTAKSFLNSLTMPYYPTMGNHDVRGTGHFCSAFNYSCLFRTVFNLPSSNYIIPVDNKYQLFMMDCTHDGTVSGIAGNFMGYCSPAELAALNNALDNGKKTLVFVHFPLKDPGSTYYNYNNSAALETVLKAHPNFVMLVVGNSGGLTGQYFVVNGIKHYMGSHKSPPDTGVIPTISYFNFYSNSIVITQECVPRTGCTTPRPITIPVP